MAEKVRQMSTDEKYNGWTNRETWAVALHINNDQGWQESVFEALRDRDEPSEWLDTHDSMSAGTAARYAGEAIRENVEDTLDLLLQDVFEHGRTEPDAFSGIRNDIGPEDLS